MVSMVFNLPYAQDATYRLEQVVVVMEDGTLSCVSGMYFLPYALSRV